MHLMWMPMTYPLNINTIILIPFQNEINLSILITSKTWIIADTHQSSICSMYKMNCAIFFAKLYIQPSIYNNHNNMAL